MPTDTRDYGRTNYAAGEDDRERQRRYKQLMKVPGQSDADAQKQLQWMSSLSPQEFDTQVSNVMPAQQRKPTAQENTDQMRRQMNPAQQRPAQQQLQEQPTRQQGQQSPMSTQGSLYDEATRHRQIQNVDDPTQNNVLFGGTYRRGYRDRLTKEQIVLETRMLSEEVDQFDQMRQQLTQNYERMDPVARTHYNDMQKQIMGLEKARQQGRLKPLEYLRAMDDLSQRAKQVKWKYHFKAPGGEVGDMIEVDGIRKVRTKDGDLQPIAYTPDYIKKNTVDLGNGKVAVPVSPDRPYEIIDNARWNVDSFDSKKKEYRDTFKNQWKNSLTAFEETYGRKPGVDPKTGRMADTKEAQQELADFEKRVHAQVVSMIEAEDRGVERLSSRSSEREKAMLEGRPDEQEDELSRVTREQYESDSQHYQGQMNKHAELQMQQQQLAQQQQQAQQADMQVGQQVKSAETEPAKVEARIQNWKSDPALATMAANPTPIRSRQESEQAPDGRVYMLPDRKDGNKLKRFYKHGGKYYEMPLE